jgi:hypothetical protein
MQKCREMGLLEIHYWGHSTGWGQTIGLAWHLILEQGRRHWGSPEKYWVTEWMHGTAGHHR